VGIDWGYVYVATEKNDPKLQTVISGGLESRNQFVSSGSVGTFFARRTPHTTAHAYTGM